MQEQVQDLISQGRLEDALEVLAQNNVDGSINLQSRFNVGKREHGLGMIDFSEWARVQAQITNSALELLKMHQRAGAAGRPSPTPTAATTSSSNGKQVFISYNHADLEYAEAVADFLKANGVTPKTDWLELLPGQSIKDFIINQIRSNNAVLSLVSENSLRSGWVGMESNLAIYSQLLTERGFVPVSIDKKVFDGDFFFVVIEDLDTKIKDLDAKIDKARTLHLGADQFENQRKRLADHRTQLPKIIDHFQNVLIQDISEDNFDTGMQNVLRAIR